MTLSLVRARVQGHLRSRCPRCPTAAATATAAAASTAASSGSATGTGTGTGTGTRRPASTARAPHQPLALPWPWLSDAHGHGHGHAHDHRALHNRNQSTSGVHVRQFHGTSSALALEKNKDAEKAKPTEAELAETQETVPEWQNPLHHDNPEMNKMFEEDFQEGQPIDPAPLPPFETDPEKVVAPPHVHDLAHRIVNLTLLELKELTEKIANHFDFDDQVMAASYGGGAAMATATAAQPEETQQEKVIFDLKLVGFDSKAKIKVIKEIRAIAGLGLKEAKELVESAPKVFQKDLKQDKAEELKARLEAVGAQVDVV